MNYGNRVLKDLTMSKMEARLAMSLQSYSFSSLMRSIEIAVLSSRWVCRLDSEGPATRKSSRLRLSGHR